ncbi:hypothetical protein DAI22_06g215400 [Oryza sativa Japonica Group]|nr:hypothetical protein DAI22_06g215400 [Oryza sativa Japonica Group]
MQMQMYLLMLKCQSIQHFLPFKPSQATLSCSFLLYGKRSIVHFHLVVNL